MEKHKSLIIIILSLFCMHFGAWGQSKIYQVTQTSDTSIVRHWDGKMSVVYTVDPSGDNYFLLVEAGVHAIRKMDVPDYITVNDFRIFHDTLFLGGHVSISPTATHGLLACLPMAEFAGGAGVCHWAQNLPTAMPDCYAGGCQNQIDDITRLALYSKGNCIQIAFIAKNHILCENTLRIGIGWAQFDGTTWKEQIIYNKDAKEAYTDIVATDSFVVAVGRTNDSSRFAMRIFPKTDFITVTPIYSSLMYGGYYADPYGQGLADQTVISDVMATALDNDKFAVAYHYEDAAVNGLALKTFTISLSRATFLNSMNVPNTHLATSEWAMRDIRYDPISDRILVLNDINAAQTGVIESIIYHFKTSALPSGTFSGQYIPQHNLYAMDTFLTSYCDYIASGKKISDKTLNLYYETVGSLSSCGQVDLIIGAPKSATLYTTYMATNTNEPSLLSGIMQFTTDNIIGSTICDH